MLKSISSSVSKHDFNTFSKLRFILYHGKRLRFDIERVSSTSESIRHIMKAYLQCCTWPDVLSRANIELRPVDYGYKLDYNGNLAPILATKPPIPGNFTQSCNC